MRLYLHLFFLYFNLELKLHMYEKGRYFSAFLIIMVPTEDSRK